MPFNNIGPTELIIVLVIALIVLGPKRLPEVGKSLGRGIREFKRAITDHGDERDEDVRVRDEPTTMMPAPLVTRDEASAREREPVA
jgi:sec-independent protein translocase protein TatA